MTTTANLSELTGDYAVDVARTRIGFVARHTVGPRVRGEFEEFEGGGHLDGADPSKSRVALTIQGGSIQTHNPPRDNLLRRRFLNLDDDPTITFISSAAHRIAETTFRLTGDLTIRGVTKPVTVSFALTDVQRDVRGDVWICLQGSAVLNRADWGVNWNAATTALISATVALEFDIAVVRRADGAP
jgi:polyisoprenoid-binding protein YceI